MLTDFDIAQIWTASDKPGSSHADFARAIESAVRAEYADVPPAIDDLAANLAMAVKQLCHALNGTRQTATTAARAMRYLQNKPDREPAAMTTPAERTKR